MGVFPAQQGFQQLEKSLPHARGGVSLVTEQLITDKLVFPTLVGVFLERGTISSTYPGLPHARGGVSRFLLHRRDFS